MKGTLKSHKRPSRDQYETLLKRWHEREAGALSREFSASLLSDAKWRKLLKVLAAPELGLQAVIVKFLRGSHEVHLPFPQGWMFSSTGGYVGRVGPFWYRSIEWLEIPLLYRPEHRTEIWKQHLAREQDVEGARRALEAMGQFTFETTRRGLRILVHIRQAKLALHSPLEEGAGHEPRPGTVA